MKIVVFDMGGTLMEYAGMPHTWSAFYPQGFRAIAQTCAQGVSEEDIARSVNILTRWNPRVNYREVDYPAGVIFADALAHWEICRPMSECVAMFWNGLKLRAEIYPEAEAVLRELKRR